MTIKRETINPLIEAISVLRENDSISLSSKYYLIKITNILTKEAKIAYELFAEMTEKFGEESEDGVRIKDEFVETVAKQIEDFNQTDITLPDIKFSLSEFEDSNLTWEQLEALMPFIKE